VPAELGAELIYEELTHRLGVAVRPDEWQQVVLRHNAATVDLEHRIVVAVPSHGHLALEDVAHLCAQFGWEVDALQSSSFLGAQQVSSHLGTRHGEAEHR
jgi:hypothetical protein